VPIDAGEIPVIVEVHVELAAIGALQRLADTAWQVDVGRFAITSRYSSQRVSEDLPVAHGNSAAALMSINGQACSKITSMR
jgi:hypothetical protein